MKESQSKKSLTIYLSEEDHSKVQELINERKITIAQWYREITRLGFYKHEQDKLIEN
ncbi:MAG: hypothetical protein HOJ48_09260, partial [Desulfobacula sp.]|nr:hypothetical protein [Desulfobacula sp.]